MKLTTNSTYNTQLGERTKPNEVAAKARKKLKKKTSNNNQHNRKDHLKGVKAPHEVPQ